MFKKNTKHQQPAIISAASELPEKQRKRLENSWAGTFYNQFFCRIKEATFAVLYSDIPSHPNVAVNVLIGREGGIYEVLVIYKEPTTKGLWA